METSGDAAHERAAERAAWRARGGAAPRAAARAAGARRGGRPRRGAAARRARAAAGAAAASLATASRRGARRPAASRRATRRPVVRARDDGRGQGESSYCRTSVDARGSAPTCRRCSTTRRGELSGASATWAEAASAGSPTAPRRAVVWMAGVDENQGAADDDDALPRAGARRPCGGHEWLGVRVRRRERAGVRLLKNNSSTATKAELAAVRARRDDGTRRAHARETGARRVELGYGGRHGARAGGAHTPARARLHIWGSCVFRSTK